MRFDLNLQRESLFFVGGAALYEAGVKLKEVIRGRALLLILNRTDIVDAVGASGVALSSDGEPKPQNINELQQA